MKNKYEFTISELVYYLYFAIMLTVKGFGLYQGQWPYDIALILGAVLIVTKLVLSNNTLIEWIFIILISLLGILIYIHSGELGILIIIGTLVGMKNVSTKRIMIFGTLIWCVTFCLSMLIALLGIRPDIFRGQSKLGLGYILRWSLGQPHPNVLQISFMILCAFVLYVAKLNGRKLWITSFVMFIGNIYIFLYSVSYTGIVLVTFYLLFNIYLSERDMNRISTVEKTLIAMLMPVSLMFSVLGPIVFKGKLWEICDKVLNTRFNIAKQYMNLNPVSLFGSGYCNELPPQLNNLDCSYVFALMHYGILFFVLFFAGYFALIIYCIKNEKKAELGIVIAMCVAAISEPFFVNSSFKNISIFFLGEFIYIQLSKNRIKSLNKCIIKFDDKVLHLPLDRANQKLALFKNTLVSNGKKIIIIGALVGIISGALYGIFKEMPSGYYVKRDTVQIISKGITLDINNLPEDFDAKILEYVDEDTPMLLLDGNAVTLEHVRGTTSTTLWCGVIGAFLTGIVYLKKNESRNKE